MIEFQIQAFNLLEINKQLIFTLFEICKFSHKNKLQFFIEIFVLPLVYSGIAQSLVKCSGAKCSEVSSSLRLGASSGGGGVPDAAGPRIPVFFGGRLLERQAHVDVQEIVEEDDDDAPRDTTGGSLEK